VKQMLFEIFCRLGIIIGLAMIGLGFYYRDGAGFIVGALIVALEYKEIYG
jgi:hypothetical protein